jgi:hypothetical protein
MYVISPVKKLIFLIALHFMKDTSKKIAPRPDSCKKMTTVFKNRRANKWRRKIAVTAHCLGFV